MSLEPVFSLHQPWASLLFTPSGKQLGRLGFNVAGLSVVSWHDRMVKEWETRPNACPPSKLGVRVWIHAAAKVPRLGTKVGASSVVAGAYPYEYDLRVAEGGQRIPLHFGVILGSVVFTKSLPIEACSWSTEHICVSAVIGLLHHTPLDGLTPAQYTEHDISDQLPYGDWTPGRFAWRVTEATPLAEPYPFKGGQGWSKSIDPALLGVS